MAHKVRTTKTPEERRAEAEALHRTIAAEVENLRDATNWTRFLEFSRHMHRYSINNLLAILAQDPDATAVASYGTWQARGYQVRRGEHGIRIFGGRGVTTTTEDPVTGEETEGRRMLYFPIYVFDIRQCDIVDPEKAITPIVAERLTGDDPAGIYDAVTDYLTEQGWTVTLEPIPGETNGYTTIDGSRRIVIDDGLTPAMTARVALHEAAHALLHADDTAGEHVLHRGIKETEAESVAYVTAGILGLQTASYSVGYVAGWSECDAQVIKDTASRVLRCAHTLAEALTTPETADQSTGPAPALDPADLDPSHLNPVAIDTGISGPNAAPGL